MNEDDYVAPTEEDKKEGARIAFDINVQEVKDNIKVCVIPKTELFENSNILDLDNETWLNIAKISGKIYSLQEFEDIFNDRNYSSFIINSFTHFIKFI